MCSRVWQKSQDEYRLECNKTESRAAGTRKDNSATMITNHSFGVVFYIINKTSGIHLILDQKLVDGQIFKMSNFDKNEGLGTYTR